MRRRKPNSSPRRPRVGRNGAKALAAATALAGGTHAYADAIRFDNKDGEFEWSRCLETGRLDVTKSAEAQDGQLSPSSFDQYRPCEKGPYCYPCISFNATSGNWIMDAYYHCYTELLELWSGYLIQEELEPRFGGWTSGGRAEITGDTYCRYWSFGRTGYAGIRFRADDGVHYGWIKGRLIDEERPNLLALAWGYETEPNTMIRAGDGVSADCTGNESLRVKCSKPREVGFRIKAIVRKTTPGLTVRFRLDGHPNTNKQRVANRRGKARARFNRVPPGQHTVEVLECGLRKDVTCQP